MYLLIGTALGVLVGVVLSRGDTSAGTLVVGAIVGATVFFFAYGLGLLLEPAFARLPKLVSGVARALTYALGGTLGAYAGIAIGRSLVLGVPLAFPSLPGFAIIPLISAAFALLVALPARAYEGMRARLSESIERLKAAEYAEKELELARAIQQRLLPPATLDGPGHALAARNVPARRVGGDFYDVFRLEDGKIGVAVADVAGKGMGAALVMATAKAVVPLLAAGRGAAATLAALNQKLRRELSPREFVAMAYATYDDDAGTLTLANAGLPEPYLLRPGRPPRPLSCPGPHYPLGIKGDVIYEEISVALEPGDRVLFLSDGLPERTGVAGEPLGYAALEQLLPLPSGVPPDECLRLLLARVDAASGGPAEDDVTLLLLERRPIAASRVGAAAESVSPSGS